MIKKYSHIVYGLLFAPVGFIVGCAITLTATGSGYYVFIFVAPVAAFASGSFFWYMLLSRRRRTEHWRAVITGILSGVISHWVCWYILLTGAYIIWTIIPGSREGANSLAAIPASAALSFFSILFFGLITVPSAILIAVLLNMYIRKKISTAEKQGSDICA